MSFRLSNVKFYFPDESSMNKTKKNLTKATKQLNALKNKLKKLEMRRHYDDKDVDNLVEAIDKAYKLVGKYQLIPAYFYANNKKYVKQLTLQNPGPQGNAVCKGNASLLLPALKSNI